MPFLDAPVEKNRPDRFGRLPPASLPGSRMDEREARALLSSIGYDPGAPFGDVLSAFQRHYRQTKFDGVLDAETAGLIRAVAGG